MAMFRVLLASAFGSCLCFGGTGAVEFDVQKLGDGVMSISSVSGAFDFSKDGRYIWLSATNCYDLAGRQTELGKLEEASFPLPRMRWKKRLLEPDGNYLFSKIRNCVEHGAVKSVADGLLGMAGGENWTCRSTLTCYVAPNPRIAVVVYPKTVPQGSQYRHYMLEAMLGSDGDVVFGTAKVIADEMVMDSMCSMELSADIRHFAGISYEKNKGVVYRITFADVSSDGSRISEGHDRMVVKLSDLRRMLDDEEFSINVISGHGFLDDNYYVFTGGRGGRFSFTARDYLIVYGFREKKIVMAFKSRLRWDGGSCISDIGIVLSPDRKHLAIRYDDVITIYRFEVGEGQQL